VSDSDFKVHIIFTFNFDEFSTEIKISPLAINFVLFAVFADFFLPKITDIVQCSSDTPNHCFSSPNSDHRDSRNCGTGGISSIPDEFLELPKCRKSTSEMRVVG
jgi:hypothetical protein